MIAMGLSGAAPLAASPLRPAPGLHEPGGMMVLPAVMIGPESRQGFGDWAARRGIASRDAAARFSSSGVVRCGDGVGTAQLTVSADVITTAAHVFYDEAGRLRGRGALCRFELSTATGRHSVDVDLSTLQVGSRTPYASNATEDWAVVRLAGRVPGVAPYALGNAGATRHIEMCAATLGSAMRIEACQIRDRMRRGPSGTTEIGIDCDGGPGASGGALLGPDRRMIGIYVGYRSADPNAAAAYSSTHYNFGITLDGRFRAAVLAAASATAGR